MVLVLVTTIALPAAASAQGGGGPGCTNLPQYNRALGALQGMTSACDMSVEQARRIVAAHDGTAVAPRQVAPTPRVRHHRARPPRQ
ncbi:hypothetical protein GCM10007887_22870 [Methylobacterium haplocladii]|nr:hypothetical protein GCM10007887_22870 [Methylobacterium haplocladii]